MGQYGVKATEPGLVCRGYQFKPTPFINECDRAKCVSCGFHYAENPLDCLSYYHNFNAAEFWLVYGDGDIHETTGDSKIACTKIEFLRRLDIIGFVIECLKYIHEHPRRPLHRLIARAVGCVPKDALNRFVIVVGNNPAAMGTREGDVLCMMTRKEETAEDMLSVFIVGEGGFLPGVYYGINGEALTSEDLHRSELERLRMGDAERERKI